MPTDGHTETGISSWLSGYPIFHLYLSSSSVFQFVPVYSVGLLVCTRFVRQSFSSYPCLVRLSLSLYPSSPSVFQSVPIYSVRLSVRNRLVCLSFSLHSSSLFVIQYVPPFSLSFSLSFSPYPRRSVPTPVKSIRISVRIPT